MSVRVDNPYIKGLLFDLDGVVTQTAKLHAQAWKQLFDQYNEVRKGESLPQFASFDPENDYLLYIDGKSRIDGIESFLASKNIELPLGHPSDPLGFSTMYAQGKFKNQLYHRLIKEKGVPVYQDALKALRKWKERGYKTAVFSASKNCQLILDQTNIGSLFDVKIDGVTAENLSLRGKPAPDMLLEATKQLKLLPSQVIVFEDSLAGVQAAKAGGMDTVIGIARGNTPTQLMEHGADIVISSFDELNIAVSTTNHKNGCLEADI